MIIRRVLAHGTLWRVAAVRPLVAAAPERAAVLRCCLLHPSPPPLQPVGLRWLSASACSKAAHQPKHHPSQEGPESSSTPPSQEGDPEPVEVDPLQDKSIGLYQRFKKTFKQYGKVLIPVHLATSSVWFGTFYYAAMKGVNVVPFLEMIGLPESVVGLLRNSSSGYALTAYAMYKIATPARYAVTLGGTSLSVQYLRKHGYLSTPPPVKEYFQDKMEETKEKLTEKMEETRDRFTEKMEETKERISEKMEETKDKLSGKLQETKDRVSEGKAFFRKKE
uniref:Family with sequence similarity 210, member A n=1 Tax=Nothobranchius kadleci TaxID=1051664 RepID=A0A1A8BI40_NOTKA